MVVAEAFVAMAEAFTPEAYVGKSFMGKSFMAVAKAFVDEVFMAMVETSGGRNLRTEVSLRDSFGSPNWAHWCGFTWPRDCNFAPG